MSMIFRKLVKFTGSSLLPRSIYTNLHARFAAWSIATKRRYAPEISLLPRFVHDRDVVVDVGAGHGLFTYHLSRLVGPTGAVHAFEPIPLNLRVLNRTVKSGHLSNVVIHPQGCSNKAQVAAFGVTVQDGIPELGGARIGGGGVQFNCELVRLDEVIDGCVKFMKVDVEGAELLVLIGAEQILRRCRPVVLFEAGQHTDAFGYEQQKVFDFLSELGYNFYSGGWTGKPLERRYEFTEAEDYFALPVEWSFE